MPSPMTDSTSALKHRLHLALSALLALGIWQIAAMSIGQTILLPSPLAVVGRLLSIWQVPGFFPAILFTFQRIVSGFLLGLSLGILLGILAGCFPPIRILFAPFVTTIKTVPVASFIVICLIWLSTQQLTVFISFLMVLPIIYTNVLQGMLSADRNLLETCFVFSISWHRRILYLWLPQLRPFLFSACTVALGLAWKAGIAAEIIGIPAGSIGRMFYDAKIYLNTTDLISWTVIVVAISILFEKCFLLLLNGLFYRLERL